VHEPVLWQVLVQVEGAGQSSSEQITAPVQSIWQPFPVQVVLQLPTFSQVTSQPPPAHVKRQLPVLLLLQVRMQPPPGQSYSQLPTVLHVQLEPGSQVPMKLPTVVELLQPEAAAPTPTRHARSSPFGLPNAMAPS
jgi:hypothetical protein